MGSVVADAMEGSPDERTQSAQDSRGSAHTAALHHHDRVGRSSRQARRATRRAAGAESHGGGRAGRWAQPHRAKVLVAVLRLKRGQSITQQIRAST